MKVIVIVHTAATSKYLFLFFFPFSLKITLASEDIDLISRKDLNSVFSYTAYV